MLGRKLRISDKDSSIKKSKRSGKKLCPKCLTQKKKSCLYLYQVADKTAVFLCSNNKCLYQRSVQRDYKVLHQLKRQSEDVEHSEKTSALKNWTFEGKRAVDTFICPLSFEQCTPGETCNVLKHTVGMLGVVMGEEIFNDIDNNHCKYSCEPQYEGEGQEEEEADGVSSMLKDHAKLCAHKEICCFNDFPMKVEEEFSGLKKSLERLNVDIPVYKQKVRKNYSMVDTAMLFKKWFGEGFSALESHGLTCSVVDLSRCGLAEMVPCPVDELKDELEAWLCDAPSGEFDFNDSFIRMFQEEDKAPALLPPEQVEATVSSQSVRAD